MQNRDLAGLIPLFLAAVPSGCGVLPHGPADKEVVALVRAAPPAPPTIGPTLLAEVDRVQVEERGDYDADRRYWPVRVRIKGAARIKVTNAFQLGLLDDRSMAKTEPVDFVEEARFTRDDFGNWRIQYDYSHGPRWRRRETEDRATDRRP